jgi:hypothetical protein
LPIIKTKVCSKCGKRKAATSQYFAKARKGKFGYKSTCKACNRTYRKGYYQANRKAIREKQNEYYQQYYQENRDKILQAKKLGGR